MKTPLRLFFLGSGIGRIDFSCSHVPAQEIADPPIENDPSCRAVLPKQWSEVLTLKRHLFSLFHMKGITSNGTSA